jgi:hypothetical protein
MRVRHDSAAHGFSSMFRDWAAETTHFQNHVVEMALAHSIGNALEAAYRRGDLLDKCRELMLEWAGFCGERPSATLRKAPQGMEGFGK